MRKPEQYFCDFCGKENPKFKGMTLFVRTRCDWTEGRPCKLHTETFPFDICEECLIKATNVECDFQGNYAKFVHKEDL